MSLTMSDFASAPPQQILPDPFSAGMQRVGDLRKIPGYGQNVLSKFGSALPLDVYEAEMLRVKLQQERALAPDPTAYAFNMLKNAYEDHDQLNIQAWEDSLTRGGARRYLNQVRAMAAKDQPLGYTTAGFWDGRGMSGLGEPQYAGSKAWQNAMKRRKEMQTRGQKSAFRTELDARRAAWRQIDIKRAADDEVRRQTNFNRRRKQEHAAEARGASVTREARRQADFNRKRKAEHAAEVRRADAHRAQQKRLEKEFIARRSKEVNAARRRRDVAWREQQRAAANAASGPGVRYPSSVRMPSSVQRNAPPRPRPLSSNVRNVRQATQGQRTGRSTPGTSYTTAGSTGY